MRNLRNLRKHWIVPLSVALFGIAAAEAAAQTFEVVPREFDPGRTYLVQAQWKTGIGCPTNARLATPNANFDAWSGSYTPYTDPACPTGDSRDTKNHGLLLAKTGPSIDNFASAVADITGVEGQTLNELGYDIRKPGPTIDDPRGSWGDAGSPRFNIETTTDFYFLACASPPPTMQQGGDGFIRLTWGGSTGPLLAYSPALMYALVPVTGTVTRLQIVFDEGTTSGYPFGVADHVVLGFGLAVLDNINVNGVRVGQGPGLGGDDANDREDDSDRPKDCDRCHHDH
jgi:hypothetical protein